ncbi:MAG: PQQ-dependent sugar dehydrogenase [Bacteroidales bacterium]|nr:PQQ-dependent sugar dehydrogenase [Bacteroidales bacterium]
MNKVIPILFLGAVVITAFWFLIAGKNSNQLSEESAAANYLKYCSGCHGAKLEKFAEKEWMDEEGITSVFKSIKNGLENLGMPAFEKTFTDSEIEALATYVKKGIPADRSLLEPALTYGAIVESEVQKFTVDTVVSGLKVPWGMAFLPNGDMLISERSGSLHIFSGGKLSEPVEGVPEVMAIGQGGLLDICFHPDYEKNGWIYFSYSYRAPVAGRPSGNTAIMRARLKGNRLEDQEIIFRGEPATDRNYHFGSKIAFDGKGHIFFGIGDRGQHFDFPQKLDNHNGKIHRLNDDGSIPADNPFVSTPGALPSIYSYGHRNPQGTCIDPLTGEVWVSEHGPRGGDELNLIKPGLNYGWPVISYGINYDGTILTSLTEKEGMEQPVFYWTPSIGPCGMTFVTGDRYPNWKNNIFLGSLPLKHLERVVLKDNTVLHREQLLEGIGRVRNVVMGPDGYIYFAIETPGMILRLMPVD